MFLIQLADVVLFSTCFTSSICDYRLLFQWFIKSFITLTRNYRKLILFSRADEELYEGEEPSNGDLPLTDENGVPSTFTVFPDGKTPLSQGWQLNV